MYNPDMYRETTIYCGEAELNTKKHTRTHSPKEIGQWSEFTAKLSTRLKKALHSVGICCKSKLLEDWDAIKCICIPMVGQQTLFELMHIMNGVGWKFKKHYTEYQLSKELVNYPPLHLSTEGLYLTPVLKRLKKITKGCRVDMHEPDNLSAAWAGWRELVGVNLPDVPGTRGDGLPRPINARSFYLWM